MSTKKQIDRLLFTSFSDVIRPRSAKDGSEEERQRLSRVPDRKGLLAEALLLSDQIVFDVSGPNLELPLLLALFGYKTLCSLLEEDVFTFSFCPGTLAYISQDNRRALQLSAEPGLQRISGIGLAWSDPFESAVLALKEQTTLPRDERRFLARLATRNTKVLPAEKIFAEAIRLANADKGSPLGLEMGFTADDDPTKVDFDEAKKRKYLDLASHNLSYLSMCLTDCTDLVAEHLAYRVLQNRLIVDPKFSDKTRITGHLFEFEDVPNIRSLVASGALSMDLILEIRKSNHLKKFREWLSKIPSDSLQLDVVKAYNSAIQQKLSSKPLYKILKVAVFTGIGATLGSVGGPLDVGISAIAADLLLNFTDTFFINKIVDGWNPKVFIDKDIKSRTNK